MKTFVGFAVVISILACAVGTLCAQETEEEEEGLGLGVELGYASMYMFRGENVFEDSSRMDQNGVASLGLSWSAGAFSVAYWGALQTNGDNVHENIDCATGAEQDLTATYDLELSESASLSVGVAAYLYAFANPAQDKAGTDLPAYVEPVASLSYSTDFAELGLGVSYYWGVPEVLEGERYVYVNPTVSRSFPLSDAASLDLAAGFGYKVLTGDAPAEEAAEEGFDLPPADDAAEDASDDNVYDVLITAGVPFEAGMGITVTPGVGAAWTNFAGVGFGDEYAVWGTILAGREF